MDSTLDTVSKATRFIKTIDSVPTHLATPLLRAIHCAALEICTAILSYLKIVITDINMGVLRMSLVHKSYLENMAITLVHGEGYLKEGSDAILEAIKNYRDCRDELTLPLLVAIHQGIGIYVNPLMVDPKKMEFYEWLSPKGVYTKHKTIGKELEFCAGNSIPEFLLSDEFQQWSQGPSNLLFCYGNRMLSSCVCRLLYYSWSWKVVHEVQSTSNLTDGSFLAIRYLEKSLRLPQPRRIAYFYFDYSIKKQSAVDVLASLLKQLASPLETMPVCLKGLYGSVKSEDPRPDQAKLLQLLVEFAEAYPEVFIFLDAFDECDRRLRGHVVSIVKRLHEAKIKVWITTQPGRLQDLEKDGLKDAIEAKIEANKTDIASYITAKLPTDGIDDNLRRDIVGTISSGVDGMYNTYILLTDNQISACNSTTGFGARSGGSSHETAIKQFAKDSVRVIYERTRAYSSCKVTCAKGSITCPSMDLSRQKETANGRTP
jgi:hypothetical protein